MTFNINIRAKIIFSADGQIEFSEISANVPKLQRMSLMKRCPRSAMVKPTIIIIYGKK